MQKDLNTTELLEAINIPHLNIFVWSESLDTYIKITKKVLRAELNKNDSFIYRGSGLDTSDSRLPILYIK